MAVRTITTRLAVDGETAFKRAMTEADASLRAIKSELQLSEAQFQERAGSVEALTEKDKLLRREIEQQTEIVRALEQALRDAAQAYGENGGQVDRYRSQLNRAKTELARMNRALEDNCRYLQEARDSTDQTARSIDGFGQGAGDAGSATAKAIGVMAKALAAAGVARGLQEITEAIQACAEASIRFESDITGVSRSVEGTEAQLAAIGDGIKAMATEIPVTTTEIASVAAAAGQLGIAAEDVLAFTRTVIDLGESTDLSADGAASALARFANIAGTRAADYERLGSLIVGLGNDFGATGADIVSMSNGLAAAGTLAGLTEAEIMALATAMSSVGIEAAAGGAAMTQTLSAIEKAVAEGGDRLNEFAEISGMSAEAFAEGWQTSPITAVQAFIAGLGRLDEAGESAALVLDDLGLSGVRQSSVLKSLTQASGQLTGAVELANRLWAENTALAEAAGKRYATAESQLAVLGNAAGNVGIAIGDALSPALNALAEDGTESFRWAAEFIEENPWLVQAITGLVAALGALTAGVAAYTVASNLGKVATQLFSAALTAMPIAPVAIAIGGLVAAFAMFSDAAARVKNENSALLESIQQSREAYQDISGAIAEQCEDTLALVAATERLAGVEHRTAAERAMLSSLVDELNEKVPGLALSYDDLNDTLNLTAEEIRQLATAELESEKREAAVERLNEAFKEQIRLEEALDQLKGKTAIATDELAKVQARYDEAVSSGLSADYETITALSRLKDEVLYGEAAQKSLEAALESICAEIGTLTSEYGTLTGTTEQNSRAALEAAQAEKETAQALEELRKKSEELAESTDTLSGAMEEQEESGALSLATTQKLIDAGYGAALAIDAETGAVTLNQAAYVDLARDKIDEQIASLETQRISAETAARLKAEAQAASHAGSAYWEAAVGRAALDKGDTTALNAQIAALTKTRAALAGYTGAAETASGQSAARARQVQTQAERELSAYKELRSQLDHERAMELVGERDYYLRLREYRDRYLTDEGNIDEYRQVTEQIFKYDKALVDEEAALWEAQTGNLVDELKNRVEAVQSRQSSMQDKLAGYGELFAVADGEMSVEDLQRQVDAIDAYEAALEGLRERGVSGGLMDEVLGMGVDNATQYAGKLLSMGGEEFDRYNALWDEKQQRALEVSEKFFRDQMDALATEYTGELNRALDPLADESFKSGEKAAQGLIDGLTSKEEAFYARVRDIAARMNQILDEAKIPSSLELAASLDAASLQEPAPVTRRDVYDAGAAVVNGMQTAAERPLYVTVQSTMRVNGKEFFTETIEDQRAVARANPEVMDDR